MYIVDDPRIFAEWNWERNNPLGLDPHELTHGSTKKVWWKCSNCGQAYLSRIDHRFCMKSGCPYCAKKHPIKGINDLETIYPNLAKEWDYANNEHLPCDYLPASNKVVSWVCPICNQSYKRKIIDRTLTGFACPSCMKESHTSQQEQAFIYYFSKVSHVENRKMLHGREVDIFLPEWNVGVEYNGEYYHFGKHKNDDAKYAHLRNKGVRIIVVQCGRQRDISGDMVTLQTYEKGNPVNDELAWGIKTVFEMVGLPVPDIDLKRDRIDIYGLYIRSIKENSLASRYPDIASEWNYSLNKNLIPKAFCYGSNKSVYWTCKCCGNDYDMKISNRTCGRQNCPYCAGKRIKVGCNDLAATHPEVAAEWHPEKNGNLTPEKVLAGSSEKAWWKCANGHEWEASIYTRKKTGCPICSGKRVLAGYNDLATMRPELVGEWHPVKNGNLTPDMVTIGSNKKAWWKCVKGHEWEAVISSRGKHGCPICTGQQMLAGYNDLATTHPTLAEEWHPTKNGDVTPDMISAGSNKRVWWKCANGHEWEIPICARKKTGCPICSGKRVLVGYNDLATTHPELAKEWHPVKNGNLTPNMVTSGHDKKVWWLCANGHDWEAAVYSRKSGRGCPVCAGRRVLAGYNDLATTHPRIAEEWHPTKNGNLTPNMVTAGSNKKAWWKCAAGHDWYAVINNRKKAGCPICARNRHDTEDQIKFF